MCWDIYAEKPCPPRGLLVLLFVHYGHFKGLFGHYECLLEPTWAFVTLSISPGLQGDNMQMKRGIPVDFAFP